MTRCLRARLRSSLLAGGLAVATVVALAPAAHAQQFAPTAEYVREVYRDLLGRDAEPGAVEHWSAFLDSGQPAAAFTSAVTTSAEYSSLAVAQAYEEHLDRAPDPAGMQHWSTLVAQGFRLRDVEAHLLGSDEYATSNGGTPDAWVRAVYVDVLERGATDGDVAFWSGVLADGVPRPTVAAAILASEEQRGLQVRDAYDTLFGRAPDAAGSAIWVAFLATSSEPSLRASLAASDEYVTRAEAGIRVVSAYFLLGGLDGDDPGLVPVARGVEPTAATLTSSLQALLAGPTTAETQAVPSTTSAIPVGTELLGASVQDGVATVDLSAEFEQGGGSASMFARLGQVVYTATQFPTVSEVDIHIAGEDRTALGGEGILLDSYRTRTDFLDTGVIPDIFVDQPAHSGVVADPMRVTGMTNAFEGTFIATVVDARGLIIREVVVTAASPISDTGWRPFDFTIDYDVAATQRGALIVHHESAETGERMGTREYPIRLSG